MNTISSRQQLFYIVIALSALVVVIAGWFPPTLAQFLYWLELPPLHSRFIASVYVYGVVYVGLCALLRQKSEATWALQAILIWNAGISLASILNIAVFNANVFSTWGWLIQYIAYAVIAALFLWSRGASDHATQRWPAPGWVTLSLRGIGIVISVMAILLLLIPTPMVALWPWKITPLLAQIYAGPLLAIGYSTWRGATGGEALFARLAALFGFAASALMASFIHLNLFNFTELSDVIWFVFFVSLTLLLGGMLLKIRSIAVAKFID